MNRHCLAILVSMLTACATGSSPTSGSGMVPEEVAPLERVIKEVTMAVDLYQNNLGGGSKALPRLLSADFDFKVITAKSATLSLNLLIFKLGGSHQDDAMNDVTYSYEVSPPAQPEAAMTDRNPPTLTDELAQTIQRAAEMVKGSGTAAGLDFKKFTVTIQYGVKWDGNAGASAPISLVTVGVSGSKSKNTVQSVRLVFSR